ncbi:2',3'-cyclic-nucleotide 2'-phosphodiesterase (5'-nucleotidase family) [Mobilisporobacter senegalensis]|uniref:2',3'-cyclic-nucleotide 2'-phosphodiesterase (5'-nucleotidase family) n=1 Tax=Mobilisporobacter senegalensis TaxID=1329262 RepID=A0A3N1XKK2_9FIRM|nr:5'-nucleotidase C-terminal domain-containing protein [Mobilisporobacter senegalensis]ROR27245.1 2',3'-cyclic-nucleotide 2'-phosphodiesterase (5'-nucleotidase family) [Mobilisporobacter senegalensis]
MNYKKMGKRFLSRLLSMAIILAMLTPQVTTTAKSISTKDKNMVELQILATSDLHGRFISYEYASNEATTTGSLAQLATAIKEQRKLHPNTILVDNGDTIQDNSSELFLTDKAHPMIVAMNELKYDTWTLGNHEFNYLPDLDHILKQSKAAVLCGNVYRPDGTPLGKNYKIINKNGVKVALIGMVTPNIVKWDEQNLKGWKVTDPVTETKEIVKALKGKVDVFIAVEHMGIDSEYGVTGSGITDLANEVPELTAVIAGHAHSQIPSQIINGVLVTEPGSNGQALSKIEISLKKSSSGYKVVSKNSELILMNDTKTGKVYEQDETLSKKLAPFHQKAVDDANSKIGQLINGDLVPEDAIPGIPTIQIQPTALISFINKVQKEYGKADISSAAGFRTDANVKMGTLSKADAAKIYKYDNTLYVVEITGAQLKNYMEWSAQYYNTYKPGDLTVSFNESIRGYNYDMFSGINYTIDISKPVVPTDTVKSGSPHLHFASSRIVNPTKADGTAVKDNDVFKLAVNNYRYSTTLKPMFGDDIKVIYKSDEVLGDKGRIRELIVDYISKNKKITNFIENNWKLIGMDWSETDRKELSAYIDLGRISIPVSLDGRTPNVRSITIDDLNKLRNEEKGKIRILTFNDLHGNVESTAKEAGVANLAGRIDLYRMINPNTIAVSAGDNYQGTAISNILYGAPINDFLKIANVEFSAIGNHEFDWGRERIEAWENGNDFAFLAANIYDANTNTPVAWAKPYAIKKINGIKIAFIGFATPETAFKTKPSNVAGLEFKDPAEIAPQYISQVKAEGADVIVALTHLGSAQDSKGTITGEAADLAKRITDFDLIISAHTHLLVKGEVNGTPIIQSGKNGRDLGVITLNMNGNDLAGIDMELLPIGSMNETNKGNPQVIQMVEEYKKQVGKELDVVIGQAEKEYPHDRFTNVSELGEWVAEVMRQAGRAQIGITNGGGIRIPVEKGNITIGTMYSLMPFDNTIVTLEMKGSDIKKLFEHGIENKEIGWIQYSGIKVFYNPGKPYGQKVNSIKLMDGSLLMMDEYYSVATNDFMAENGDNYDFSKAIEVNNTNIPIRDVLIQYIKEHGKLNFNSKNVLIEGKDISANQKDIIKGKKAA